MQLESHFNCSYDYLAIHDGNQEDAPLLESYCNTTHPEPFTSPGNEVSLHFHSDGENTDTGFQLHYSVVSGIPGCGGTFTGLSGEIASPMKDGEYHNNIECEYLIKMPPGSRIEVEFTDFSLEYHSECSFDFLELYEGGSDQDPLVKRYCGTQKPEAYQSQGNKLLFKFKSDYSNPSRGFKISYRIGEWKWFFGKVMDDE